MIHFATSTERDTTPVVEDEEESRLDYFDTRSSQTSSYTYAPLPVPIQLDLSESEDEEDEEDVDGHALDHMSDVYPTDLEESDEEDEDAPPAPPPKRVLSPPPPQPTRTNIRQSRPIRLASTSTSTSTSASSSVTKTPATGSNSTSVTSTSSNVKPYPRRPIAPSTSRPSPSQPPQSAPGSPSSPPPPPIAVGATSSMYHAASATWVCDCHRNVYRRKGDLDRHLRESVLPAVCDGCHVRFKRKDPRIRHWDKDPACEVRHHVANYGDPREMARWQRRWSRLEKLEVQGGGAGAGARKPSATAGRTTAKMRKEIEELLAQALAEKRATGDVKVMHHHHHHSSSRKKDLQQYLSLPGVSTLPTSADTSAASSPSPSVEKAPSMTSGGRATRASARLSAKTT